MKHKLQDIINNASVLFADNGIRKTPVDLICHNCGISKKTFYQYFPDKETIVNEIVKNAVVNTEKQIEKQKKIMQDAPTELSIFFRYMKLNLSVFTPVFMSDLIKFYPKVYDLMLESKNSKFLPFFSENVKRGISEGYYRKSLDAGITAALYFKQLDYALADEIMLSEKFKFLSYINSFFLHGIVNMAGAEVLVSSFDEDYSGL
jgi:AcrR family transcriptional regulator